MSNKKYYNWMYENWEKGVEDGSFDPVLLADECDIHFDDCDDFEWLENEAVKVGHELEAEGLIDDEGWAIAQY